MFVTAWLTGRRPHGIKPYLQPEIKSSEKPWQNHVELSIKHAYLVVSTIIFFSIPKALFKMQADNPYTTSVSLF